MSKTELRKSMFNILKNMNAEEKLEKSKTISQNAYTFIQEREYQSVGIVLPMAIEYDTWGLIDLLLEKGIEVYSPVCDYTDKSMNFHRLNSRDEVRKDNKNIPIPDPEQVVNNNIDLLVVPGLIFGPTGYRIGYGGGFYDRFLTTFNNDTVSLIFSDQIGDTIIDSHDLPVDYLITEDRTFDVKSVRVNEE